MRLCLVRHAIAADPGLPGFTDDFSRPLTEKGRARMEAAAGGLRRLVAPDVIFSSPLVRAKETAEIVAAVCGIDEIRLSDLLASTDYAALLSLVAGTGAETVLTVGHEPSTSEMISLLLTGDPGMLDIIMKKGGAALVRFDGAPAPGTGTLEWLIQPAGLRAMGADG